MQFKPWLLQLESLLHEDFKTQREKFIQQGYDANIVDIYLADFKNIKDKKYKQINDPIHGLEYIKDRTNVDQYKEFQHLEALVDYIKGQVDVSGKTNYKNIKIDAKPVYEDDNIIVYYADSPQACVTYKGSVPYSWCIAKSGVSNMFYHYRIKEHEPAFYFIKNKEKTNKEFSRPNKINPPNFIDKYHFFVIQVLKNANLEDTNRKQYIVTSAANDGDTLASWNDLIKIEPLLIGKQDKLKHIGLNNKELYEIYKKGISDKEFAKLTYDQKDFYLNVYVREDIIGQRRISDDQFKNLPFDLKNKYIGFATGLTDNQFNLIVNDDKLVKRYEDVTLKKLEEIYDENRRDFKLFPSEIEIFKKNIDKFDLKKDTHLVRKLIVHVIKNNNLKMLEDLVKNGAKISNDYVKIAIKNNSLKMVKYLVKNGAIINDIEDEKKGENIIIAAQNKSLEMVKYLVEKGAKIWNYAITNAKTPEIENYLIQKQKEQQSK